jgi:hypothetical protein
LNPGAVASAAPKAEAPVQITLDAPKATAPVAVKPKVGKLIAVVAVPMRKVNRVNVRRSAPVCKPVIAAAALQVIAVQPASRAIAKSKVVSVAQTGARVANACNGGTATRRGVRCGSQTQLHDAPRANVATVAPAPSLNQHAALLQRTALKLRQPRAAMAHRLTPSVVQHALHPNMWLLTIKTQSNCRSLMGTVQCGMTIV